MRMIRRNRFFWIVGLLVMLACCFSDACSPLPVLLYPADEVYQRRGVDIPELPDDAIAVLNGNYLLKTDFKEWLYRKIGFDPVLREKFVVKPMVEKSATGERD